MRWHGQAALISRDDVATIDAALILGEEQNKARPSADHYAQKARLLLSIDRFEDGIDAARQALKINQQQIDSRDSGFSVAEDKSRFRPGISRRIQLEQRGFQAGFQDAFLSLWRARTAATGAKMAVTMLA